jgi:hypothetical protein
MRSLRWPSFMATPKVPPVREERSLASLVSAASETTEQRILEVTRELRVWEMEPGSVEVKEERRRRTSREEWVGRWLGRKKEEERWID